MRRAVALIAMVVLGIGACASTPSASPSVSPSPTATPTPRAPSWTDTGSLGAARSGHTATLLADGRVLVVGGLDANGGDPLASAELYDPAIGSWSATGSLGVARSSHEAVLLPDGRVLVAGGSGQVINRLPEAREYLRSAELYDPGTGRWTPVPPMAAQRSDFAAVLLTDGTVLAIGGAGRVAMPGEDVPRAMLQGTTEVFDPAANAWTTTTSMVVARDLHTATRLDDGRVLVVGWTPPGEPGGPVAGWELYDPTTRTWSSDGTVMLTARWNTTATLLGDGRVLVAGGVRYQSVAAAEIFDPATGEWNLTGEMTEARVAHTATLLSDGTVLAIGGAGDLGASTTAEIYRPEAGAWGRVLDPAIGRLDHTATLLPDGRVLVVGGLTGPWDTVAPTASAELYDPGFAAVGAAPSGTVP